MNEDRIVWLEPVDNLDYVRVSSVSAGTRNRSVGRHFAYDGRLVGYAILRPDAPNVLPGTFGRRIFWLARHDRDSQPDGPYLHGCPTEAVDPATVAPNQPGRITDRAWGDTIELFHDGEVIESSPQKFRQLALL